MAWTHHGGSRASLDPDRRRLGWGPRALLRLDPPCCSLSCTLGPPAPPCSRWNGRHYVTLVSVPSCPAQAGAGPGLLPGSRCSRLSGGGLNASRGEAGTKRAGEGGAGSPPPFFACPVSERAAAPWGGHISGSRSPTGAWVLWPRQPVFPKRWQIYKKKINSEKFQLLCDLLSG